MRKIIFCCAILGMALCARAQDARSCKLPVNLEKLAGLAAEAVEVNLDENMIRFAGGFLNKNKHDEAQAAHLLGDLKYICVRSFQFDQAAPYTEKDLDSLRAQLQAPLWSRMVGVRSKRAHENADVFFRVENGEMTGLAVIAASSNELAFVHIDGKIRPEQLSELGGQFGIPQVSVPPQNKPAGKETSR